MASVVVDSNVLLAARLARDQDHERGAAIVGAIDGGELPSAIVLNDVLAETLNYLNERASHKAAVETLDALLESRGFEIVHTTKRDFDVGRSLFRGYDGLSLTDAVIGAFMDHQEIEYVYSFDGGFDELEWLTRLDAPVHPTN